MTHGQPHEEAEHAAHHAADPFDRRVAMSMVVIAAILAAVKVLGHRTHNETLQYQIKANVAHTQESDQWNFFQAKKMREVLAELRAALAVPDTKGSKTDEQLISEIEKDLQETTENLGIAPEPMDLPSVKEQAKEALARAKKERDSLKKKYPDINPEQLERFYEAKVMAARYRADSRIVLNYAARKHEEAREDAKQSNHRHHMADYFDMGELGVELALVLASVAILTKRASYWYAGMAVGLIGLISVAGGFFVH
jgi:hypothetical protein